jgi:hypothetical protein
MPQSYALYPMTHLCSIYAIGPLLPIVTVMSFWLSLYIDEVHSLYSLVLISHDFLFSRLLLCGPAVGLSFILPPLSPLHSPQLSLTVRS